MNKLKDKTSEEYRIHELENLLIFYMNNLTWRLIQLRYIAEKRYMFLLAHLKELEENNKFEFEQENSNLVQKSFIYNFDAETGKTLSSK